jgi:hypothetical protein
VSGCSEKPRQTATRRRPEQSLRESIFTLGVLSEVTDGDGRERERWKEIGFDARFVTAAELIESMTALAGRATPRMTMDAGHLGRDLKVPKWMLSPVWASSRQLND